MTVRRLMQEMDADELRRWAAFYGMEPWGSGREDGRAIYQAQASLAAMGGGKLDTEAHFPHLFADAQAAQTEEEQAAQSAENLKMSLGYYRQGEE